MNGPTDPSDGFHQYQKLPLAYRLQSWASDPMHAGTALIGGLGTETLDILYPVPAGPLGTALQFAGAGLIGGNLVSENNILPDRDRGKLDEFYPITPNINPKVPGPGEVASLAGSRAAKAVALAALCTVLSVGGRIVGGDLPVVDDIYEAVGMELQPSASEVAHDTAMNSLLLAGGAISYTIAAERRRRFNR